MRTKTIALWFVLLIWVPVAFGADGEKLYQEKCAYCHDNSTVKVNAPALVGKTAEYLLSQVDDIVSKKRQKDYSQIMESYMNGNLVMKLNDKIMVPPNRDELKLIIGYLAKQK